MAVGDCKLLIEILVRKQQCSGEELASPLFRSMLGTGELEENVISMDTNEVDPLELLKVIDKMQAKQKVMEEALIKANLMSESEVKNEQPIFSSSPRMSQQQRSPSYCAVM